MDCKFHTSITYLDQAAVADMVGESIDFSYPMLNAVEQALPKDLVVYYCCIYDHTQKLVAFLPVYVGRNVNINALAPELIQKIYNGALTLFGESAGLKVAVAGCLVSDKGIIPIHHSCNKLALAALIVKNVDALCRQESVSLCAFKDMHQSVYKNYTAALSKHGYLQAYSLPTIVIASEFDSFDEYRASLTKNARKHCKKTFRKAQESNLTVEVVQDFKDLNVEVCSLFRNTFLKAKYQFEELSPQFFYSLADANQPDSELVICKRDDKIIGALMNLYINGVAQLNKRIGLDYTQEDTALIYMLLNYYGVKTAIQHRVKKIYLGQSTYIPKTRLGGYLEDQFLFLKSYSWLITPSTKLQQKYQYRYRKENVYRLLQQGVSL